MVDKILHTVVDLDSLRRRNEKLLDDWKELEERDETRKKNQMLKMENQRLRTELRDRSSLPACPPNADRILEFEKEHHFSDVWSRFPPEVRLQKLQRLERVSSVLRPQQTLLEEKWHRREAQLKKIMLITACAKQFVDLAPALNPPAPVSSGSSVAKVPG